MIALKCTIMSLLFKFVFFQHSVKQKKCQNIEVFSNFHMKYDHYVFLVLFPGSNTLEL